MLIWQESVKPPLRMRNQGTTPEAAHLPIFVLIPVIKQIQVLLDSNQSPSRLRQAQSQLKHKPRAR